MTGALPTGLGALGHDPERVRELARDILSRSPFVEEAPTAVGRLIETVLNWIGEALGRLLSAAGAGSLTAWLIVAVSAALLGLVVWRWTRGVSLDVGTAPETVDPRGRTAAAWLASSRAAQERGDLTVALRERYLAVVATLIERGILGDEPGRTIRELDAELTDVRPDLHEPVAAAGARLERVLYGGTTARSSDIEVVDAAVDALATRRGVRV